MQNTCFQIVFLCFCLPAGLSICPSACLSEFVFLSLCRFICPCVWILKSRILVDIVDSIHSWELPHRDIGKKNKRIVLVNTCLLPDICSQRKCIPTQQHSHSENHGIIPFYQFPQKINFRPIACQFAVTQPMPEPLVWDTQWVMWKQFYIVGKRFYYSTNIKESTRYWHTHLKTIPRWVTEPSFPVYLFLVTEEGPRPKKKAAN